MYYIDSSGNIPIPLIIIGVAVLLKAADYGWTAWDVYDSSRTLTNKNATINDKFLAASNIIMAGSFELLEPDDWTPINLPIDDAARKGVMAALKKAVGKGGLDGGYRFLQGQFGSKADDIIRQVANAMGSKIEIYHIASDKAIASGFTEAYKKIFDRAGMSLQDPLNKMALTGHSGGHTDKYRQFVLRYITDATNGLSGDKAKAALTKALTNLRDMLNKNTNMPYKGGL